MRVAREHRTQTGALLSSNHKGTAMIELHDLDKVSNPVERAKLARENVKIALANLRKALAAIEI